MSFKNNKNRFLNYLKKLVIPGFEGMPFSFVLTFFFNGLKGGVLHVRASSVSYNTLMAVPPTIIFFFTLIPYLPIPDFDLQLMELVGSLLPESSYKIIESTLYEIVTSKSGGLLSFGFIASFFFSTNGMHNLIVSFNATTHDTENRNWLVIRLNSFLMVIIQTFLLTIAVVLLFYGRKTLNFLVEEQLMRKNITYYLIDFGKWFVIVALFFSAISSLYLIAPVKKEHWRFISAGATTATIFCLVISLGYSYFVNHFGQYNKLYGSIGSLMATMLWVYLNILFILIGFELNASIKTAHKSIKNINFE